MKKWIKLFRIHHWLKNMLIFFPILFGGRLFDKKQIIITVIGTLSFCLLSSAIYVINDINDIESDRLHDIKKNRPIAAREISKSGALVATAILLLLSIVINIVIFKNNYILFTIFAGYFFINIGYSIFEFKNIPIVDVVLLVSGFFLRVLYGSVLTGIVISNWLYLVIITGAFYLGFGKRRNELMQSGISTRKVLKFYTVAYLDKNMNACMTLAIVFFSFWCIEKNSISKFNFLIFVPWLIIILLKYGLDLESIASGDPIDTILGDKILLIIILLFACSIVFMMYWSQI